MQNLSKICTDEEDMPSPTSNHQKTALEANKESEYERLPKGLPNIKLKSEEKTVADIIPIGNLVIIVNKNLKTCPSCKKYPLN